MANGTCQHCNNPLPEQTSGRPRKFCSDQCARRGAPSERIVEVPCVACGTLLRRKERNARTRAPVCSHECKTAVRSGVPLPADHAVYWVLGQWSSPLRYYDCADCGALVCYDARSKSAKRCPSCRVAALRHEWSRRWHKRRARMLAAYVQDVNPEYIYKRDRFTCQICHKRLAMKQQVPHPKAPTIDHIIPLAKGGTHEPANVQAAHFMCNCTKSDGAAADQLLLVG